MTIRRNVRPGGARFGKLPTERKVLTPQEREDELINALRALLRRLARHLGIPEDQINTKVTRLLTKMRAEVQNELRS